LNNRGEGAAFQTSFSVNLLVSINARVPAGELARITLFIRLWHLNQLWQIDFTYLNVIGWAGSVSGRPSPGLKRPIFWERGR
jgi:hypothetical protein